MVVFQIQVMLPLSLLDVLIFESRSREGAEIRYYNKQNVYSESLINIIIEVFPELKGHITSSFGVFITPKEANIIRKELEKLRFSI